MVCPVLPQPAAPKAPTSLPELATYINAAHARCQRAGQDMALHALTAGRGLIAARAELARRNKERGGKESSHGLWEDWMEEGLSFSAHTARGYVRIAERWDEVEAAQNESALSFSIRGLLAVINRLDDDEDDEDDDDLAVLDAELTALVGQEEAALEERAAVRRAKERLDDVARAWCRIATDARAISRRAAVVGDDELSEWAARGLALLTARGRMGA